MNKTNRDVRLDNVKVVIEKLKFVRSLQTPYVDNNSLSTLGIQLSHLSLHDGNGIDFEPGFCKPFPAQKFDELFKKAEKDEWASAWDDESPYWRANSTEDKFSKYLRGEYDNDSVSNSIWKMRT